MSIPILEPQTICANSPEAIHKIISDYQAKIAFNRFDQPNFHLFFRGQSCSSWKIEPSILRSKNPLPESESQKICSMRLDNPDLTLFDIIGYLQHYQSGTRFIDYTLNAEIALFFACKDHLDFDGALFLYPYDAYMPDWDFTKALIEITLCDTEILSVQELSERLFSLYPAFHDNFHDTIQINTALISFLDHGFMVIPSEDNIKKNLRLQRQQGCFYVCGAEFLEKLTTFDRFSSRAGSNRFYTHKVAFPVEPYTIKIIIPREIKPQVLKILAHKGITESFLFPPEKNPLY